MRTIGVVTVGRSDYGIYLPILRKIASDTRAQLRLIVTGMHLSPEFGLTLKTIEADGLAISERVEMLLSSDSPEGIAKSIGLGVIGLAQAYARLRLGILVVMGDRFEMHAAALAALPFRIPVAHLHGGELTQGAIDDALRHSITKLSHLHLVSTEKYARRVVQIGGGTMAGDCEWCAQPGQPAHRDATDAWSRNWRPAMDCGLPPPLLVTFHPVTLEYDQVEWQTGQLLAALEKWWHAVVFTMPNADTGGRVIQIMLEEYVRRHASASLVDNLGTPAYFGRWRWRSAMVGNSSSGIIEAPSFGLPVVNVGTRQQGRVEGHERD